MCRPKSQGGRRCPSHSDPVKRAARNAKKRELYRANKLALIENMMNDDHSIAYDEASDELLALRQQHAEFFSEQLKGESLSNLYKSSSEEKEISNLNIQTKENTGYLVERDYFAPKTVTGQIDYLNLDENSYKDFGFKEVDEYYYSTRSERLDYDEIIEMSEIETDKFDEREKLAMTYYTSDDYKWFNEALYTDGISISAHEKLERDIFKDNYFEGYIKLSPNERTKETVKLIAQELDSALERGPKVQRIVYRGAGDNSEMFKKYGGVKRWLEEEAQLGQELKFDNYQSTSVDYDTAYNYTASRYDSQPGLIYEILTPEGINITAKSQFDDEYEVLLPRDSRYMVVGKHYNAKKDERGRLVHVLQLVAINEDGEILDGTNETPKEELFKEIKI